MIGAVVFSHWVLDLPVHRADLPLLPGDLGDLPRLGLGLWRFHALTAAIEATLLLGGAFLYWRAARRTGAAPGKVGLITALIVACGGVTLALDLAGISRFGYPGCTFSARRQGARRQGGCRTVTDGQLSRLDTGVPHSARFWSYWLGGKDNFASDRAAGDEIGAFFDGLELLPPGIVPCSRWRPGPDDPDVDVNQYCGVARKVS